MNSQGLNNYPIEGDFIETREGYFFEIKDFHQPHDKTVGFIRYYPIDLLQDSANQSTRTLTRRINDEIIRTSFQKLYEMKDRYQFLQNKSPKYIFRPNNYYYQLQAVNNSEIISHYQPEKKLQELKQENIEESNHILKETLSLCDFLASQSNIPLTDIGISGSLLLGLENQNSDIDLIIYGYHSSLKVRETLRECFKNEEGFQGLRRYSLPEFKELYKTRAKGSPLSFFEFLKYEFRKLHQGKYRNRDFFIRFLEFNDRVKYSEQNLFEQREIYNLGRIVISGEIRGDEYWWTTPARVQPINIQIENKSNLIEDYSKLLDRFNLKLQDIVQTFTLRGRYIENVRLLEHFIAQGTLELVVPRQSQKFSPYLQLELGTDASDFIGLK